MYGRVQWWWCVGPLVSLLVSRPPTEESVQRRQGGLSPGATRYRSPRTQRRVLKREMNHCGTQRCFVKRELNRCHQRRFVGEINRRTKKERTARSGRSDSVLCPSNFLRSPRGGAALGVWRGRRLGDSIAADRGCRHIIAVGRCAVCGAVSGAAGRCRGSVGCSWGRCCRPAG